MSSIFESIAPSLDLCKQIPAGEFEESKLVWTPQFYCYTNDFIDPNTVLPRTIVSKDRILAPSPTASELFNVLSKELTEPCVKYVNNLYVFTGYLQFSPDTKSEYISLPLTEASTNLADAALRMWLNITEIKNNANKEECSTADADIREEKGDETPPMPVPVGTIFAGLGAISTLLKGNGMDLGKAEESKNQEKTND